MYNIKVKFKYLSNLTKVVQVLVLNTTFVAISVFESVSIIIIIIFIQEAPLSEVFFREVL